MTNHEKRGVKRKYEPPQEDLSTRIAGKLHHEIREVHKASKKAKTFETQKVIKKLKDLRKKDESSKEIPVHEEELTCLKDLDHDSLGNTAFKTKINKDRVLRENEHVKAAVQSELSSPSSSTTTTPTPGSILAKIHSRLLSSKILAAQITLSIEAIKALLDVESGAAKKKKKDQEEEDESDEGSPITKKARGETPLRGARLQEQEDLDSESNGDIDSAGWESGSIGSDGGGDHDQLGLDKDGDDEGEDALAEAAGWESGSVLSDAGDDDESGVADEHSGSEEEDEGSDGSEDGSGGSERVGKAKSKKAEVKGEKAKAKEKATKAAANVAKKSATTSSSMFLPSLSVGFTRGDDDSEVEDDDDDIAPARKNRRGQRARRAIWEKKFGRNANHKKKEAAAVAAAEAAKAQRKAARGKGPGGRPGTGANASKAGVDAGWGGKRAIPGAGTAKAAAVATATASGVRSNPAQRGPNAQQASSKGGASAAEKPLHPSWEAKRKLKEQQQQAIVPSLGKKIKF